MKMMFRLLGIAAIAAVAYLAVTGQMDQVALESFKSGTETAVDRAKDLYQDYGREHVEQAADALKPVAEQAEEKLGQAVEQAAETVKPAVGQAGEKLGQAAGQAEEALGDAVSSAAAGAVEGAKRGFIESLRESIQEFMEKMKR